MQRATLRDEGGTSVLAMGGRSVEPSIDSRATEVSIRGFWNGWRSLMAV